MGHLARSKQAEMNTYARNRRRKEAICHRSLIYRIELSGAKALFSRNSEAFNLDQITAASLRRRA